MLVLIVVVYSASNLSIAICAIACLQGYVQANKYIAAQGENWNAPVKAHTCTHRQDVLHVKLDHNLHWNTIQWDYTIILVSALLVTQLCAGIDVIHQVVYTLSLNRYKPTLHGITNYIIYKQQNRKRLVLIIYCIVLMVTIDISVTWLLYNFQSQSYVCIYTALKIKLTLTGPKREEVSIFWQMIWEHQPSVVVMLTNVKENGKVWLNSHSMCFCTILKVYLLVLVALSCSGLENDCYCSVVHQQFDL